MTATVIPIGEEAAGWERALYAFLAEKERRSGSRRTVEGYSRTSAGRETGRREALLLQMTGLAQRQPVVLSSGRSRAG